VITYPMGSVCKFLCKSLTPPYCNETLHPYHRVSYHLPFA